MKSKEKLYNTRDAAAYCDMTFENFRYYIKKGKLIPDLGNGRGSMMAFRESTLDELKKIPRASVGYPGGKPRLVSADVTPSDSPEKMLVAREAAAYCGLQLENFRYYVREGRIEIAGKAGKMHIFRQSVLDAFKKTYKSHSLKPPRTEAELEVKPEAASL